MDLEIAIKILSKLSQAYSKRPWLNEKPKDISDHFDLMLKWFNKDEKFL